MASEATPIAAIEAFALALDAEPVPGDQVVKGWPQVGSRVLATPLPGTEVGVWEMTEGAMRDVEVNEVFVVLAGRARVEADDGTTIDLLPGTVGVLRAGTRTVWTVHEPLRKVYAIAAG